MKRLLFIAGHALVWQVTRRKFLVALILMPFVMMILMGVSFSALLLMQLLQEYETAIGYVDHAGVMHTEVIEETIADSDYTLMPFIHYPDEQLANAAFVAGEIDAYVVVPPAYMEMGDVFVYGDERLTDRARRNLRLHLIKSLLAEEEHKNDQMSLVLEPLDELSYERVQLEPSANQSGPGAIGFSANETLALEHWAWFFPVLFIFAMMFLGGISSSSSYLLQGLVDEKENRTMEIVVTSVTPEQLIGGKTLGLSSIGLVQLAFQFVQMLLLVSLVMAFFPMLHGFLFILYTQFLPVAVLFFTASYFLYAGLTVMVGALVTSVQEGQQLSSFIIMPFFLPLLLFGVISSDPHSALAVGLSMFPVTSTIVMLMRLAFSVVPIWQVLLSLALLAGSAWFTIRFSAWVFRQGMLRYGKRIKLRELLRMVWYQIRHR